jgi:hypothetical protein
LQGRVWRTLSAKSGELETGVGRLRVKPQARVKKLVCEVKQVTLSSEPPQLVRQLLLYLTKRADGGCGLAAPGVSEPATPTSARFSRRGVRYSLDFLMA